MPAVAEAMTSAGGPVSPTAAIVHEQLDALQEQILALQDEITMLRKRDETLKFYMHRLDEELRLAARLQHDFLPKHMPEVGKVRFHTLFRPAGYVSGDLYDVLRLDEKHVGFYVADAVGHGMPAALLTMFMKRALVTKEILLNGYRLLNPSEAMAKLNEALLEQHLSQATFATALYGTINVETLQVAFARGGHPNPILLTSDGAIETLDAEGGLLGIFNDETYGDAYALLRPGDRMFVFTDGVEVAFSDDVTVDTRQWREEIFNRRHLPTAEMLDDLGRLLDTRNGSIAPKDDLTIIGIDVLT